MSNQQSIEDSAICHCCQYDGLLGEFEFNNHECPKCFSDNWTRCDYDIYEGLENEE